MCIFYVKEFHDFLYFSRLTKPLAALAHKHQDDEDVWQTNLHDRYLARPDKQLFNAMSFAYFASNYVVLLSIKDNTIIQSEEDEQDLDDNEEQTNSPIYKLQDDLGYIRKRSKFAIIRYPKLNRDKDPERYYANLLRAYYPHSTSSFKPDNLTYQQFFSQPDVCNLVEKNMTAFEQLGEELDNAWTQLQENPPPDDAWAITAPSAEEERISCQQELAQLQDIYGLHEVPEEAPAPEFNITTHHIGPAGPSVHRVDTPDASNLNEEQQQLLFFIKMHALASVHGDNPQPYHIYLSGGAGTGKSHLIDSIHYQVTKIMANTTDSADEVTVLKVAPTGVAAYNIHGQTIHSALSFMKHTKATGESDLNTLRCRYSKLHLIIIDEISMVPQHLLNQVHERLQNIKNCNSTTTWFGNTNVLTVGDFHQLPPVYGQPLYLNTNIQSFFTHLFHRHDLQEIMRQQHDKPFAQFLNRLRLRERHESLYPQDIEVLQQAATTVSTNEDMECQLHVHSTNNKVNLHNHLMLSALPSNPVTLVAADYVTKHGKLFTRDEPFDTSTLRNQPSLPDQLTVKENAHVMLISNIDTADGLVNGVTGTIVRIPQCPTERLPPYIAVQFHDAAVGAISRSSQSLPDLPTATLIKPMSQTFDFRSISVTRMQYPLTLAWALTIHKVQGKTVDDIVVSLEKIFKPGMAYVALSRVTKQQGLHIKDLTTSSIYTNPEIEKAIAQMPKTSSLPFWSTYVPALPNDNTLVHLGSFNIEGFNAHLPALLKHYFLSKLNIILLQETWLTHMPLTIPQGYSLISRFRADCYKDTTPETSALQVMGHGGVSILHKHTFPVTSISTSHLNAEIQAATFQDPRSGHLTYIVNCYRPPMLPTKQFISALDLFLSSVPKTAPLIVAGDFNINFVQTSPTNDLVTTMSRYSLTQVITSPTTTANTTLDLIFARNLGSHHHSVCPQTYGFHHATTISF